MSESDASRLTPYSSRDEIFMRRALELARHAEESGEVPVGALVVLNDEIIGEGWNQPVALCDPTAHAEMIAITQAADFLRSQGGEKHRGSLEKASLYVTVEPCPMCAGALVISHCEDLIFAAKDAKTGACGSLYNIAQDDRLNHRLNVISGIMENDAKLLLQEFFRSLRKDKR